MDKIEELLTRGTEEIIPNKKDLEKVLRSGKKLRIYQGFDPTSPELHIGHLLGLRKLRQWQDLGHEVIFLIGDFTGMIGDPTGKDKTRIPLTKEQVLENAKTYKEQAEKILRFEGENPVRIKYNSEWLEKLSAKDLLELTYLLSIQQIIKRDLFQRRFESNQDVAMNEFLYPIMQGYDSVAMDIDVEVGGSDQLFNMMVGRDLMHKIKRKSKFVMTTPLLTDGQGKKIGKTEGNAIALTDKPEDLFGKLMALPDEIIIKGFEYLTDVPMEEIGEIKKALEKGSNPVSFKKQLAYEIVKEVNNETYAKKAQEHFERTVQKKEIPQEIEEKVWNGQEQVNIIDLLEGLGVAPSRTEAKRLVEQGGLTLDGVKPTQANDSVTIKNGSLLQVGKRRFLHIKTN